MTHVKDQEHPLVPDSTKFGGRGAVIDAERIAVA